MFMGCAQPEGVVSGPSIKKIEGEEANYVSSKFIGVNISIFRQRPLLIVQEAPLLSNS